MQLDWYDRRILDFVLTCATDDGPSNGEALTRFGIDSNRVMRRFDAVVDVYTSHRLVLDAPDSELVARSSRLRHSTASGTAHVV